jgi:hypothetical protein
MALVLKDRVKEQTTTTGTGSVTLGGAVSGFEAFSAVGDGNTTYYAIVHQTADEWEVGLGTYTAAGTLLSRDTILESSNSDAAVVFSAGTKDVFVTYPSDKAVYYDAAGTVNIDSLRLVAGVTVTSILDEDNMASNSATALSTQQSIKAYVDAQVGTADTLSEVLALGNTTGGTDIAMTGGDKITNFESTGINDDAASTTITINSAGNVGIGTSTLNGTLLVIDQNGTDAPSSSGNMTTGSFLGAVSVGGAALNIGHDADGTWYNSAYFNNAGVARIHRWLTGGAESMRIDTSGNVGIGISSPATKFHVLDGTSSLRFRQNGTVAETLTVGPSGGDAAIYLGDVADTVRAGLYYDTSENDLQIRGYNNSTRILIDSSGNVGIGTSSPTQALEVAGTIRSSISSALSSYIATTSGGGGFFIEPDDYSAANPVWEIKTYASEPLAFQMGGTERMRIESSGNVGIGTTAPAVKLEVNNGSATGTALKVSTTGSGHNFDMVDGTGTARFRNVNGEMRLYGDLLTGGNGNIIFAPQGTTERMRITSAGNVGIGTASPSSLLHLASTGPAILTLEADTDNVTESDNARIELSQDGGAVTGHMGYGTNTNGIDVWNDYGDYVRFGTGNAERMRIISAGNVGIGTTAPAKQLHITKAAIADIGTLTDGATITPDFDANQNFSVTLGGNRTLANPTNIDAGQTGSIFVVQDATGGRTLSFGSYWKFAGGTAPTLSTGANAVDRIDYIVKSSTEIHAVASLNLS